LAKDSFLRSELNFLKPRPKKQDGCLQPDAGAARKKQISKVNGFNVLVVS